MLKKQVFIFLTLTLIVISMLSTSLKTFSFEAHTDSLYELRVRDLKITEQTSTHIEGQVVIENYTDRYFPDLSLATELYIKPSPNTSNLINKEFSPITIRKTSTDTYNFTHQLPYPIPDADFDLLVRLYSRTGIPLNLDNGILKDLGESEEGFLINDPKKSHLYKDGEELDELSGPNYEPDEAPVLKLFLKNISEKKVEAMPEINVFNTSYLINEEPVSTQRGNIISFAPGEEKELEVMLPAMQSAKSYLAVLNFIEQSSNKQISPNFEARYVVKGPNASILSHIAKADTDTRNLTVENIIIGPADMSLIENATLEVNVFIEERKKVHTVEQTVDLSGEEQKVIETNIPLTEGVSEYLISSEIIYNDETLDISVVEYDTDFMNKVNDDISQTTQNQTPDIPIIYIIIPVLFIGLATLILWILLRRKDAKSKERRKKF